MNDPMDGAVQRMLDGDDAAFRVVYRSIQPNLVRYLSALVGPNEAEDVASETWGQVIRDLESFRGGADGFRGWVTTIGRHRALDHLRARGRRPRSAKPDEPYVERVAAEDVEESVAAIVATQAALDLIATLPAQQAEAVLLRAVMGLDARTAGAILDRSPGAVRTAAYRGLRTLAERIRTSSADPDPAEPDPVEPDPVGPTAGTGVSEECAPATG